MPPTTRALSILAFLIATAANAASTVRLPPAMCPGSDTIFRNGFEATAIPSDPSNGSGGAYPGDVTRTISVPGLAGAHSYYLHLPAGYTAARSWPLLLVLRGSVAPASMASAAQQVRGDWSGWSDGQGFIVLAPVGNSTQGGWGANGDSAEISAALNDAFASYNVERSRVYLWGFSAGAHYGHALALNNTDFFAAYGVSAGSLEQYACTDSGAYPPTCAALLSGAQPKIPVDIHLGSSDPLASSPYTAAGDPQRLRARGWADGQTLFYVPFNGGHNYTVAQLGEVWNHLCPFALGP
ncbi:PHB depolymerase family esterase [Dokdonella sp.]|uniref:PHB depolymerase family esterase n=1 Tax=Dokdonella sp. TaxID=2291710 RepID=UPI00261D18B1|nr:PHB depolymerase family esterase [Dokdonella sp.]